MNDGLLGIGYCHAMAQPHTPSRSAMIHARWDSHWSVAATIASKRDPDPAQVFGTLRESYFRRIDRLLTVDISWAVIKAGDLDSPLQSGTEFDRALCLAIERRRCRMGRIAGKGKKYANRK